MTHGLIAHCTQHTLVFFEDSMDAVGVLAGDYQISDSMIRTICWSLCHTVALQSVLGTPTYPQPMIGSLEGLERR